MANLLHEAVTTNLEQKPQFTHINRLRAKSQEITRQVFNSSGKAFIAPFDRSDMFDLAKAIDEVAGYINISSRRIHLYQPESIGPAVKELAVLIIQACNQLRSSIQAISNLGDTEPITDGINKIRSLEHQADKVYNKAVAKLLANETNAIELIKTNEILHALERATDKCELVTNVMESIMIKNS